MLFEQGLKQTLSQKIDPKLIMANTILQLTTAELQQVIEQELAENPALEVPDDDPCENCDQPKTLCIDCPFHKEAVSADDVDLSVYELEQPLEFANDAADDEEGDFISNIRAEITLSDYLNTSLRAVLDSKHWDMGEYVVSYINDAGYLETCVEDIALQLSADMDEVETVLRVIQTLDPPGVGARDLQECLRIQLERLAEEDQGNEIALAMVRDFWQEMLAGKIGRIARRLKVSAKDVVAAIDFIKKQLNPYPGNSFRPPYQNEPDRGAAVRPDVIIRRTANGYEIEVLGGEQYVLGISSNYRRMYEDMRNGGGKEYSKEDRKHIQEFVERADLFIRNINQRRRTLRHITKLIAEYQQGYLETGAKSFLRPLTRTRIARMANMHESTVSRATANKYIQLPSEEVVSFDFFFDSSVSVKDMIGDLIASEDKASPLSDQQIAEILQERGFSVARRTVVKYREAQKILSSRQRRI